MHKKNCNRCDTFACQLQRQLSLVQDLQIGIHSLQEFVQRLIKGEGGNSEALSTNHDLLWSSSSGFRRLSFQLHFHHHKLLPDYYALIITYNRADSLTYVLVKKHDTIVRLNGKSHDLCVL